MTTVNVIIQLFDECSRSVFFNLGSSEPRGSAKIFLGSAKYLNILLFIQEPIFCQVSLGQVRYYLLLQKSWGAAKFFEGDLGSVKFILVILGSATIKRLKNTVLDNEEVQFSIIVRNIPFYNCVNLSYLTPTCLT